LSKAVYYVTITTGDKMVNQENIEKLFDVLDKSSSLYYKRLKLPYLEGLVKTCENILSDSVIIEDETLKKELQSLMLDIKDLEFNKEEIRKAFQYSCLRGLKHQGTSNQLITPDSIGLFFSYLIEKLYDIKKMTILDPLIGSGNLITTLANNLDKELNLIGVEKDLIFYKLSQALFGMLEYQENIYYQDVLSFENISSDLIVTDFSGIDQSEIYLLIKHFDQLLKDDSFLISVIDNSFFDDELIKDFIFEVKDKWHFFGMIVLPESIFKNSQKSIFILQKIGNNFIKPEKFLVADLPDFNNEEEMFKVIDQLNDWFNKIEFYRVRENNEKNNGS